VGRLAVGVALLAVVACADPAPDDAALHQDIATHQAGAEVTFHATLIADPQDGGGHEILLVRSGAGDGLEIDHNTTLARRVPAHSGDQLVVHGQLYLDPGKAGVHCTHAQTSSGCPVPGWIDLGGSRYQ
jgi:hypothetical protein